MSDAVPPPDDHAANPPVLPEPYASRSAKPVGFVPRRVVSLVPSLTESLFDLDLGGRLIGITDYCTRPAGKVDLITRVGGTKNPDLQRIMDLGPDLVLLSDEENRLEDAEALHGAGLSLWTTGPRTVFDTLNMLWDLMDVFDHALMVPRVREIERAYDYTQGAARAGEPVRVFAPVWRDPWMTFNRETYAHDLLAVCGGQNVFAERERQFPLAADLGQADPLPADDPRVVGQDRRYPRITLEEVVAAQPEVVLLPSEPYLFGELDAAEIRRLEIPAAQNDRVHLVDGSLLFWPGTRLAFALNELPGLLMRPVDGDA